MSAPTCTCEVEMDMGRRQCRVFMCPMHTAAPDLYAALEQCVEALESWKHASNDPTLKQARAALAKTRGEAA